MSCVQTSTEGEKRILVIGHRGNPVEAPENTLASIAAAFAAGADIVEIDVRLSRDRVPVVIHDDTVDRTTDGAGFVADKTLAELKALDAGSWKDERFSGERIPTLVEALVAARGKGPLLLDVPVPGMGPIIAEAFRTAGIPVAGALVATWDDEQRRDVVAHLAGATIVRAEGVPASLDDQFFEMSRAAGVEIFDLPDWSPAFVTNAQAHGFRVWVYTVNDARTIGEVVRQGVDGFETDDPRMAVDALRALAR